MPRISNPLIRRARKIDRLLPPLLRPCRDLESAQNELRWLREHAQVKAEASTSGAIKWSSHLKAMVEERSMGKPLQYIMGTEYFGDLELACRPGVLIPRWETAASATQLVEKLQFSNKLPDSLRVLDLCTGTGCIPLLFEHLFKDHHAPLDLQILGVDISSRAVRLAKHNRDLTSSKRTHFVQGDVLADQEATPASPTATPLFQVLDKIKQPHWDILISNPPYISPSGFAKTTSRSVRNYEPKLALVPPANRVHNPATLDQGDIFYPRLLDIAKTVGAKIVLFEVSDLDQALRVAGMAKNNGVWTNVVVWRDDPGATDDSGAPALEQVAGIDVHGSGNGRSVVCWRANGSDWLAPQ